MLTASTLEYFSLYKSRLCKHQHIQKKSVFIPNLTGYFLLFNPKKSPTHTRTRTHISARILQNDQNLPGKPSWEDSLKPLTGKTAGDVTDSESLRWYIAVRKQPKWRTAEQLWRMSLRCPLAVSPNGERKNTHTARWTALFSPSYRSRFPANCVLICYWIPVRVWVFPFFLFICFSANGSPCSCTQETAGWRSAIRRASSWLS